MLGGQRWSHNGRTWGQRSKQEEPQGERWKNFLRRENSGENRDRTIHCVEEKKVSLLGQKKADGMRQGRLKAKLSHTMWTIGRSMDSTYEECGKPVEV